ncbi:MAG: hypothetical protein PGN08_16795 [Sphingomonas taxi]
MKGRSASVLAAAKLATPVMSPGADTDVRAPPAPWTLVSAVRSGRNSDTSTNSNGFTASLTASLTKAHRRASSRVAAPLSKVTRTIRPSAALMLAAPMRMGTSPCSFDSRSRRASPPAPTRTCARSVTFSTVCRLPPVAAQGLAVPRPRPAAPLLGGRRRRNQGQGERKEQCAHHHTFTRCSGAR